MADYRFTKFPLGLLILVASGIGTTASAQQEWPRNYPPPVHVAPIDELSAGQAARLARSPGKGEQQPRTAEIAQASHVVDMSAAAPMIAQEQMFFDNQAPPHRVIQAVQPHAPVPRDWAETIEHSDQYGVRYHQDPSSERSAEVAKRWQHHPHAVQLPGVENDPSGAGPGRLGLGAHWVRTPSQSRPTIPNASVQPSWKTPYSYGYFGSPSKRHWTRQTGYRDRYLQWTLR